MQPRTTARLTLPLALVVVAPLLATCSSWAAPPDAPGAAPATSAVRARAASTTPSAAAAPRIHPITVSVSKGVTTMPSRLLAGTYYVHVATNDDSAALQVVRPPSTLSLSTWYSRLSACQTYTSGESAATGVRQCRYWRTSAAFAGGANVVRVSTYGAYVTPGGRATFAITLSPGRYWFYSGTAAPSYGGRILPRRLIRTITVVGAAERAVVPVAAVARFAGNTPTMPRVIPRRGFALGIGEPGVVTVLGLWRLKPWVTDADLVPGKCFVDGGGAYQALQCFDGGATLGGGVSAGHSALWWYDLPPGEYLGIQDGMNEAGDSGLFPSPKFARVTIR